MTDELWTTEQVAAYFKVSPRTVQLWRFKNVLTGPLGVASVPDLSP